MSKYQASIVIDLPAEEIEPSMFQAVLTAQARQAFPNADVIEVTILDEFGEDEIVRS